MASISMTNSELATTYLKYNKRPDGCVPFATDGAGRINIPAGEAFCRVGHVDGDLCANNNKYQTTNALREHIRKQHPFVTFNEGKKGPASQQSKATAQVEFARCQKAVLAHITKLENIRANAEFALTPTKGRFQATKNLR
ncbi:hypothetical protein B0O99DRAFT_591761 [Bisporella sp. PMI_857]|nr:hypothetical protein B0O99DRAFT_591761 [Bisporella sp. PMI_857]